MMRLRLQWLLSGGQQSPLSPSMCGMLELDVLQPEAAYRLHSSAGTCKLHGFVLPAAVRPHNSQAAT